MCEAHHQVIVRRSADSPHCGLCAVSVRRLGAPATCPKGPRAFLDNKIAIYLRIVDVLLAAVLSFLVDTLLTFCQRFFYC